VYFYLISDYDIKTYAWVHVTLTTRAKFVSAYIVRYRVKTGSGKSEIQYQTVDISASGNG